jgi:hypothetical protein
MEMLEMRSSINQIINSVENIISMLNQAEERISGIADKVEELLQSENNKEEKTIIITTFKNSGT